jgi:hypothetical protein
MKHPAAVMDAGWPRHREASPPHWYAHSGLRLSVWPAVGHNHHRRRCILVCPSSVNAIFSCGDFHCGFFGASNRPRTLRATIAHSNIIKNKNEHIRHCNGYAVQHSAPRLPDGSFSSNLLLERTDSTHDDRRYRFHSPDYFMNEEQALQHSTRCARNWVDTRG